MPGTRHRVVIVGGGFGGLYAARKVCREARHDLAARLNPLGSLAASA